MIFILISAVLPLSAHASSPLEKTLSSAENGEYTFNIYQINTEEGIREYLVKYLKGFTESNVELIGITIVDFKSAEDSTLNGSFSFFAEFSYKDTRKTTELINGTIYRFPVIINAGASQSSIFAGDELTLNADISDYDGGKIYWYGSSNPNKNGKLISESKTTHITISPDVGIKYYYCLYKGTVSNTVSVRVTEAFVPISDIAIDAITLTCGKSTNLSPQIYPENATKTDITWNVIDGDATAISDKITVHTPGIITVKATVPGGGEGGSDYEKFFEFYAEKGTDKYKEVKWSILPPVDGILQMNFTANEKKDIQITSVSSLTANKMINSTDSHSNMEIIAGAYIVCDNINSLNEISVQLSSDHANKEVHVISSDDNGNISSDSLTVSETGEIILPAHKSTYVVTSTESSKADLSFLVLLLPLVPLILIPIFLRAAKYKERLQEKK